MTSFDESAAEKLLPHFVKASFVKSMPLPDKILFIISLLNQFHKIISISKRICVYLIPWFLTNLLSNISEIYIIFWLYQIESDRKYVNEFRWKWHIKLCMVFDVKEFGIYLQPNREDFLNPVMCTSLHIEKILKQRAFIALKSLLIVSDWLKQNNGSFLTWLRCDS